MEQGMGGRSSRGQSSYRGERSSRGSRGYGRGANKRRNFSEGGNVIKARGLPYETSEGEVSDFFAEYNVSGETSHTERSTNVYFLPH